MQTVVKQPEVAVAYYTVKNCINFSSFKLGYNCNDITLMPYKVFPDNKEFEYVSNKVMEVLNIIEPEDDKEELVKEAKN